jgi:peptidoglycan pentaglycine glycine transferase (the first glycine)
MKIPSFYLESDPEHWNRLVERSAHAHIMQSWEWGEYKSHLGWEPCRLAIRKGEEMFAAAQILFRTLPLIHLTIGYIPKGPLISCQEKSLYACLLEGLNALAKKYKTVFIRMEPAYTNTLQNRSEMSEFELRSCAQTNQPRCTIMVDLTPGEKAVFERFNRNTRRLIRKAEEDGVIIEEGCIESIEHFYAILKETAKRKHLPMQKKDFYIEAYRVFEQSGKVKLLYAKYQNQIVSSLFVFFYKNVSMHLWAGNSPLGLKCNASHIMHWTAMRLAIMQGYQTCDLWGIPDEIAEMIEKGTEISRQRSDGLWGVYRFKEGFGGSIQCFVGTYDHVLKPGFYKLMRLLLSGQTTVDRISSLLHHLGRTQ